MPKTSQRTSLFGESVIRRMTRVANAHNAINLSQGFPDFDPPEALLKAAEHAARNGPHQYAVTWGAPNFRAALARNSRGSWAFRLIPTRIWLSPVAAQRR
jgi:aminotransferase